MQKINIHEAKTRLSRLVEDVVERGDSFIISKAGKPMVKVVRLDAPITKNPQRLGFFKNPIEIPEDFDCFGKEEISQLFLGGK